LFLFAARQDSFRVWGRFDHGRPGDGVNEMLTIVGGLVLLLGAWLVWRRLTGHASRYFTSDSSGQLFRELCAAHGLKFTNRRLLKRLAASRGLKNPAMLFIEPQHFEAKNLPEKLKLSAGELQRLRVQLFGN
jgi:hypothetical protein